MKILRIINSMNPKGGGPIEGIFQSARHMMHAGHRTAIVTLDDPRAAFLANSEIPIHAVGEGIGGYRFNWKLVTWIKEHGQTYDAEARSKREALARSRLSATSDAKHFCWESSTGASMMACGPHRLDKCN